MNKVDLIGMIAAVCTTVSFFPQVIKVYKTGHTRDLSFPMYLVFSAGTLLWMAYGILMKSPPIIAANAITFILCSYILSVMIRS